VLPGTVRVGARADGVKVVAHDPVEVWYGTFEDALEVEVDPGHALQGAQFFAREFGPVRLATVDGTWDLAGWERLSDEEIALMESGAAR
jgi:hypothetical protein